MILKEIFCENLNFLIVLYFVNKIVFKLKFFVERYNELNICVNINIRGKLSIMKVLV